MSTSIPKREDRRRELTLWVLCIADQAGVSAREALDRFERAYVGPIPTPSAKQASEFYRVERFEDYLPETEAWDAVRPRIVRMMTDLDREKERVDKLIADASPRWRLDRMPLIDRTLLRIGVMELVYSKKPRPRATINGLIELAKRFGSDTTPAFVNGILDQIRRDLDIPFA